MDPDKRTKSSAEKRRSRGPNSPWAQFGAKKAERTERWHKAKYPSQFIKLQRFIKDHNISHDALLTLLAEHYAECAPSDTQDAYLAEGKHVQTPVEWYDGDGGGPSSSSGQPVETACKDLVSGTLPPQLNASPPPQPSCLPDEIVPPPALESSPRVDIGSKSRSPKVRRMDSSPTPHRCPSYKPGGKKAHQGAVGFHANAHPPPQPPFPPDWLNPPNAPVPPPRTDAKSTAPFGKSYSRAPQIPPLHRKQSAKRLALHRDLDNLIGSDPTCSSSVWEEIILAGNPVKPKFTAFRPPHGGTVRPPRLPAPVPFPSSPLPCGEDSDFLPSHRSVWEDHALPPKMIDDRPPGGAYIIHPSELFTVGPGPPSDAAAKIAAMRMPPYFKPSDGTVGGYVWATGISPGSAGRRVKYRFEDDGNCRTPSISALAELTSFTSKRSLPTLRPSTSPTCLPSPSEKFIHWDLSSKSISERRPINLPEVGTAPTSTVPIRWLGMACAAKNPTMVLPGSTASVTIIFGRPNSIAFTLFLVLVALGLS